MQTDETMDAESEYGGDDFTEADFDALEKEALAKEHDSRVKRVTEGLTENLSTFSRHDVDRALQQEMNITVPETRAELVNKIIGHPNVIGLKETADGPVTRYTTRAVLTEERQLLDDADALSEMRHHRLGNDQRAALLRKHDFLNVEQRRAVTHVTDAGGVAMLKGEAGTGKTKVLSVVREGYETAGKRVLALSFTNNVVQDLRQNAGFVHVNTVDGELSSLARGRTSWKDKPVVVVDEAAMLSTKHLSALLCEARKAGAKVIAAGDDHQLPSIKRGGAFGLLANFHGAAELHEVLRVKDAEQKRAFNHMHKGAFKQALAIFDKQKAIHWKKTAHEARRELVATWARDTTAAPEKTRLVFAYANEEVESLNAEIREVYRQQGRLGSDHNLKTVAGPIAVGDRLQFTDTDKSLELYNGRNATVLAIKGTQLTVRVDGASEDKTFNTTQFNSFGHGYAGTIHRGQGKTLDHTYLLYSSNWRAKLSYVALTRHRERTALFVTTEALRGADPLTCLAKKMGRIDDRPAASKFHADIDAVMVNGMATLKVRDGLPGQIAGQRRKLTDLEERDGGSIFRGLEPSRLAAHEPEERVKRLKTHHKPQPDAVMLQATGAPQRASGAFGNAILTAGADRAPARIAQPPVGRNLDPRLPCGSSHERG